MEMAACTTCGRRVAATDGGMCPSCGLPVASATSATPAHGAPSATSATSVTDATTRPIAPAPGATPLPTAGAAAISTPSAASMETQPIAPPARAEITDDSATRPMPPAALPGMVTATAVLPPSTSDPAPGARLRTLGIVGIVVALLIILALAALVANGTLSFGAATPSATPTPTATATPTAPPNFTAFTASSYFTVQVPAGWNAIQIAPQDAHGREIRNFTNPTGDTLFVVLINDSTLSPLQTDESVLAFFAGKTTIQNHQGPETATVAGQTWTRESADLTIAQIPGQSHVIVMTTTHGKLLYTIFFSAPSNSFEAASVGDFQPMLNSFAFVG